MKHLILSTISAFMCLGLTAQVPAYFHGFEKPTRRSSVVIEKDFLYDKYTLPDEYDYKDTQRRFQWDEINQYLVFVDFINGTGSNWAIIKNYKNINGAAPLTAENTKNDHNMITDMHGVTRYQSVPMYSSDGLSEPERYGRDGSLVAVMQDDTDGFYKVENVNFAGEWYVPEKYVDPIDAKVFHKVIFVDRTNQNIAVLEKGDGKWFVRSMNPATTGLNKPPFQYATPVGIFVLQEKRPQMFYNKDGTNEPGGYAPYANRFTNGGFIHGVPVNLPATAMVEYSQTLGTTPRSHMCVRNATSHAKFVYDWAPVNETLIIVID